MAILGFRGHLPLLPVGGSGGGGSSREYDFLRVIKRAVSVSSTFITYVAFIDAYQTQGNESLLNDELRMIGNQLFQKIYLQVDSNTHTKAISWIVRESEDATTWGDAVGGDLLDIPTITTGLFTNTDVDLTMNDDWYYNLNGSADEAGTGATSSYAVMMVQVL